MFVRDIWGSLYLVVLLVLFVAELIFSIPLLHDSFVAKGDTGIVYGIILTHLALLMLLNLGVPDIPGTKVTHMLGVGSLIFNNLPVVNFIWHIVISYFIYVSIKVVLIKVNQYNITPDGREIDVGNPSMYRILSGSLLKDYEEEYYEEEDEEKDSGEAERIAYLRSIGMDVNGTTSLSTPPPRTRVRSTGSHPRSQRGSSSREQVQRQRKKATSVKKSTVKKGTKPVKRVVKRPKPK